MPLAQQSFLWSHKIGVVLVAHHKEHQGAGGVALVGVARFKHAVALFAAAHLPGRGSGDHPKRQIAAVGVGGFVGGKQVVQIGLHGVSGTEKALRKRVLAVEVVGYRPGTGIEGGNASGVNAFHLTGHVVDGAVHVVPRGVVAQGKGVGGSDVLQRGAQGSLLQVFRGVVVGFAVASLVHGVQNHRARRMIRGNKYGRAVDQVVHRARRYPNGSTVARSYGRLGHVHPHHGVSVERKPTRLTQNHRNRRAVDVVHGNRIRLVLQHHPVGRSQGTGARNGLSANGVGSSKGNRSNQQERQGAEDGCPAGAGTRRIGQGH